MKIIEYIIRTAIGLMLMTLCVGILSYFDVREFRVGMACGMLFFATMVFPNTFKK